MGRNVTAEEQTWVTKVDPALKSTRDEPLQTLSSKTKGGK